MLVLAPLVFLLSFCWHEIIEPVGSGTRDLALIMLQTELYVPMMLDAGCKLPSLRCIREAKQVLHKLKEAEAEKRLRLITESIESRRQACIDAEKSAEITRKARLWDKRTPAPTATAVVNIVPTHIHFTDNHNHNYNNYYFGEKFLSAQQYCERAYHRYPDMDPLEALLLLEKLPLSSKLRLPSLLGSINETYWNYQQAADDGVKWAVNLRYLDVPLQYVITALLIWGFAVIGRLLVQLVRSVSRKLVSLLRVACRKLVSCLWSVCGRLVAAFKFVKGLIPSGLSTNDTKPHPILWQLLRSRPAPPQIRRSNSLMKLANVSPGALMKLGELRTTLPPIRRVRSMEHFKPSVNLAIQPAVMRPRAAILSSPVASSVSSDEAPGMESTEPVDADSGR